MNKLISTKKLRLLIVGRSLPLRDGKVTTFLHLVKNWILSTKIWKNLLFYQHSQTLYDVKQNEIENLEFVQGVNFEFIDSAKKTVQNSC